MSPASYSSLSRIRDSLSNYWAGPEPSGASWMRGSFTRPYVAFEKITVPSGYTCADVTRESPFFNVIEPWRGSLFFSVGWGSPLFLRYPIWSIEDVWGASIMHTAQCRNQLCQLAGGHGPLHFRRSFWPTPRSGLFPCHSKRGTSTPGLQWKMRETCLSLVMEVDGCKAWKQCR